MDGTRKNRRVNSYKDRITTSYEYDGSAVRKIEELPGYGEKNRKKKVRSEHKRPNARRYSLSGSYVLFITVVCIAVSVLCVLYISQKSALTRQYDTIADLETEYNQLKSNNDAKYNQVMDSVGIEDIKEAAQGRLGMSYAGADRIIYYDLEDDSYVRQYKDVPTQ